MAKTWEFQHPRPWRRVKLRAEGEKIEPCSLPRGNREDGSTERQCSSQHCHQTIHLTLSFFCSSFILFLLLVSRANRAANTIGTKNSVVVGQQNGPGGCSLQLSHDPRRVLGPSINPGLWHPWTQPWDNAGPSTFVDPAPPQMGTGVVWGKIRALNETGGKNVESKYC